MANDLYVRYQFVLSGSDRGERSGRNLEVVLTVGASQLEDKGWARP